MEVHNMILNKIVWEIKKIFIGNEKLRIRIYIADWSILIIKYKLYELVVFYV